MMMGLLSSSLQYARKKHSGEKTTKRDRRRATIRSIFFPLEEIRDRYYVGFYIRVMMSWMDGWTLCCCMMVGLLSLLHERLPFLSLLHPNPSVRNCSGASRPSFFLRLLARSRPSGYFLFQTFGALKCFLY